MGCSCRGPRAATSSAGKWFVFTVNGDKLGGYLTQTEARIAAQQAGGGVVKQLNE